ncbi:hypothetical protein EMPS_01986 [Entomortierella parvispora]|uniref:F-box domain-containing protein n=1 Tax=Entomortierella parvispora TaxID=205924 RepID=A0A9P3LT47_9FUNG|nr:hypothetical protein EMPS_01986 [Entomortierella parvispora]
MVMKDNCLMEPNNPLAVPELLVQIGLYLGRPTLASSIRVSRFWYNLLLPRLWYDLRIKRKEKRPPMDTFRKNAAYIRRLSIDYPLAWEMETVNMSFPYLSTLDYRSGAYEDSMLLRTYFIKKHAATLIDVTTDAMRPPTLEALNDCPNLTRLQIHGNPLKKLFKQEVWPIQEWIRQYKSLWSRLLFLSLSDLSSWTEHSSLFKETQTTWIRSSGCDNTDADVSHIQELRICHPIASFQAYTWLIEYCPDLRRLTWVIPFQTYNQLHEFSPMQQLADWVQAAGPTCQHLEEIALPRLLFRNEDWRRLLSSVRRLSCLDLSKSAFNLESWNILQAHPRHLKTLQRLDLRGCSDLTGKATHAMMCEMPNLEVFRAGGIISSLDLLEDPRPWCCLGLKELALEFMNVPEGVDREMLLLNSDQRRARIAQSNIDETVFVASGESEDVFSLITGLRSLETLSAFSILNHYGTRQELKVPGQLDQWLGSLERLRKLGPEVVGIGEREKQWFRQHWPMIEIDTLAPRFR